MPIDDIFSEMGEFGLLDDEPQKKSSVKGDLLSDRLEEVNQFYKQHGRPPLLSSEEFEEKRLGRTLKGLRRAKKQHQRLAAFDTYNLLTGELPIESAITIPEVINKSEQVMTLDDIFADDDVGLLAFANEDIFTLKYVTAQRRKRADNYAQRTPCADFHRFVEIFSFVQHGLKSGEFGLTRFTHTLKMQEGDFFVLNGILGYVNKIGERLKESKVWNARLHLVFENGMEMDMLYLSLTHGLVRDRAGRKVTLNGIKIRPGNERLVTGHIYVLQTLSNDPALQPYKKDLYKIGLTKGDISDRIKYAEREKTYLEAPVEVVLEMTCYDINLSKLELLIHTFLQKQRLNITLQGNDGQCYRPREWFDVPLDTIEEVIKHILDGTIVEYRMNNITRKIVKKS